MDANTNILILPASLLQQLAALYENVTAANHASDLAVIGEGETHGCDCGGGCRGSCTGRCGGCGGSSCKGGFKLF